MNEMRVLGFSGVDPSYRDQFLAACARLRLVHVPYFEPFLDFCLEGGLQSGRLIRIADIISNNHSPAYKAHTGAGVRLPPRQAERDRVDEFLLSSTSGSSGTLLEITFPDLWPDGHAELFKATAVLPEGLSTVGLVRSAPGVRRVKSLAALLGRLVGAGHRGPLLTIDDDGDFVTALMAVAFGLKRRVEWVGRVSPQQTVSHLDLEVAQPGATDAFDVHDLLDSAVATPSGEAFAHASRSTRDFVVYRPRAGGPCYAHISPRRTGATFTYLQHYLRRAVADLESVPVVRASAPLESFYAVRKAVPETAPKEIAAPYDVEAPYAHAIQMLLLATHYPLFVARLEGGTSVTPITDPPAPSPPSTPRSIDIADSGKRTR